MAKDKAKGKARGRAKGRAEGRAEGGAGGKGRTPGRRLPKDQRPGLVDRLAVVVGVAFAASLAWQHLPV